MVPVKVRKQVERSSKEEYDSLQSEKTGRAVIKEGVWFPSK